MKKTSIKKFYYSLLLSSLLTMSCENTAVSPVDEDNKPNLRALSVSEQQIVQSSNDFAFNLLRQVNEDDNDKNIFISPLSIGTALAMTYNGAEGVTKEEIKNVLGFDGLSEAELNTAYKDLQELLLNMDNKTQFNLANSIWYKNNFTLKDGFSALIKENYDGEIRALDFDNPESKNTINKWVEEKTQNRIKDLVKEINSDHRMFLVNAIYFKSTWTYKFEKSATKPMDFHLEDGTTVKRDMMFSDKIKFLISGDDQVQMIDLLYGNKQFSMSILLPKPDVSLDEVINGLNSDKIKMLVTQADTADYHLYMPKFKLEYEKTLNETLKSLGIKEAFIRGSADFSRFFNETEPLHIDKVNHKTFIQVDEEGTEAAAATSVAIGTYRSIDSQPFALHINRPFVLLIREKSTENILFAGKILDPQ